jgi:TolB protein
LFFLIATGCGRTNPAATSTNRAPNQPSNPVPADGASISDSCTCLIYLSWTGTDPDAGDSLRYDLCLGKTNPPATLDSNIRQSRYLPSALDTNSVYFWKVTARDKAGLETDGPVWQFTVMP